MLQIYPNCSYKAILDIYTSRPFQRYKEHLNARCFGPCNRALSFRESRRTPKSHFRECEWRPHTSLKVGLRQILFTKLVSATFLSRICFVIIMGKRDIKKLSILPSSQNGSNFDYHGKISQHLPLSLNQKPRHLSLPLRLYPPRVILIRMLGINSTMLTRRRCFKPMQFKFRLYKMNSNN